MATAMNILDHIQTILQSFEIEPKPLDRILAEYLRRHREIGARDRRLIGDVIFGVARWRRRLDGFLVRQGQRRPDAKRRALCYLFAMRPEGIDRAPFEPLARRAGVAIDAEAYAIEDPKRFPGGAAGCVSFPDLLFDRFVRQYGAEGAREVAEALNKAASTTLRVNTLKADRAAVLDRLREARIACVPTARSPFGIVLGTRVALDALPAFREGWLEVQDEASQIAALLADPRPGDTVLDLCAGAGGKSLAMAMLMEDRGRIDVADVDGRKRAELIRRARRAGVHCLRPIGVADVPAQSYGVVLVDAPCSGTGTLRRSPDRKWRFSEEELAELMERQRHLLLQAIRAVRPGGRLVYCTCSILAEENEEACGMPELMQACERVSAADALLRHGISSADLVEEDFFRTDPKAGSWDGFFGAVFRRKEGVQECHP